MLKDLDQLKEEWVMVSATGKCDMLQYRDVAYVAMDIGCLQLASLTKKEYWELIESIVAEEMPRFGSSLRRI